MKHAVATLGLATLLAIASVAAVPRQLFGSTIRANQKKSVVFHHINTTIVPFRCGQTTVKGNSAFISYTISHAGFTISRGTCAGAGYPVRAGPVKSATQAPPVSRRFSGILVTKVHDTANSLQVSLDVWLRRPQAIGAHQVFQNYKYTITFWHAGGVAYVAPTPAPRTRAPTFAGLPKSACKQRHRKTPGTCSVIGPSIPNASL